MPASLAVREDYLTLRCESVTHCARLRVSGLPAELVQPFVADAEMMRDLVQHDVPDLRA